MYGDHFENLYVDVGTWGVKLIEAKMMEIVVVEINMPLTVS